MRILILIFILLMTFQAATAQQKQAAWWMFGDSLTIDFNLQPMQVDTGRVPGPTFNYAGAANATISDAKGNLLFYSNGLKLNNRYRQTMSNGFLYTGTNITGSLANLIVDRPGSSHEYYFFNVFGGQYPDRTELTFNFIDMRLDSSRGDVATGMKNVPLLANPGPFLTVLLHANNIDYWLVASSKNSDTLYTYPITSAGIGSPIITPLPFSLISCIFGGACEFNKLKSSPDSEWLAANNKQGVELLKFNRATGAITPYASLLTGTNPTQVKVMSVAFSADNSKLYVGESNHNFIGNDRASNLYQFDLSVGSSTSAIQASRVLVDSFEVYRLQDMQLGINGKLYILPSTLSVDFYPQQNWLSIIHCPDLKAPACRLQKQGLELYGRFGGTQLPTLNQTLFRNAHKLQALAMRDTICYGDSVQLSAFGAAADRFRWFPSGTADTIASPYVKPLQTTTYTVIGFSACRQDTAQVTVTVLTDENTKPNLLAVSVDTVDESRVNISYSLQPAVSVDLERKTGNNWQAVTALSLQSTATTDTGLFASEQNYYYRLRSLSQCQTELWSEVHKTVLLQASDQQKEKVMLKWSAYKGWETEPVTYQVWQKTENEQTYQLIPALTTTDTSTIVTTAGIGFMPCFKVKAISSGRQSWSNSVCLEVANLPEFYNIITPNGDSKNDAFIIRNLNLYPNSQLQIFNRWGSQVFSSDNYQNNWQAGKESSGIYFYRFTTQNGSTYKGWVEVVK